MKTLPPPPSFPPTQQQFDKHTKFQQMAHICDWDMILVRDAETTTSNGPTASLWIIPN
jgi:hypothetical protein